MAETMQREVFSFIQISIYMRYITGKGPSSLNKAENI